jgi:hypothetical protein
MFTKGFKRKKEPEGSFYFLPQNENVALKPISELLHHPGSFFR